MASASVTMALPMISATQKPSSEAFFRPLPLRQPKRTLFTKSKVEIHASLKEKALTAITTASFTASMVIPEVAHAAGSDLTPSLKNFLLSIFAGGVVLGAIFGAVIGVSNFDPGSTHSNSYILFECLYGIPQNITCHERLNLFPHVTFEVNSTLSTTKYT
ncbi:uncharacterized protein LOC113864756 [Abrus precatorius]|uniref:Uncharacterized protein LOC113864756 n=1 Tax=Abrus precatorius TaxID=3816 RepID=A0A8B8LEG1_ABRPR|nr:uncharacterized protein LOC113864756 [Abrus precatorius]